MADFLASFNFGAADDEPIREEACASLEEVQSRFRDAFEGKVTETRAEHIKTSIEIGPSAQFTIFGGGGENVDPSLSRVTAREALVSQPQKDPTTQCAVSQEILNAIGEIEGSTWSKTDELRKTQGWVLTYACNHSWQEWTGHGKAAQTHAILDYSQKELDFTARARPAFDCRGTVTITFSKGNSAITVNYSHTPIHRTVGELYDLYKPPPPPKAIAKKKAPGSAKKSDTPRRKRAATGADGEPAPKKPRSRPQKGAKNQLSQAELVPVTDGDFSSANGATTVTANDAADHVALAALSAATAAESTVNNNTTSVPKNNTASLNVSSEEAARRREVATKRLTEAGINPSTLSTDQFSIFSNQSPEVQTESLNMLVKYGAGRLHIVHPAKKDSPRPPPSQADAETIASSAINPNRLTNDSASESVRPNPEPAASKRGSKTPQKAKGGGKSRVFCFNLFQGQTILHSVLREKSAAFVTDDDNTMVSQNVDANGEAEDSIMEDAVDAGASNHQPTSSYGQVPIANMMQITPDKEGNGSHPIGDTSAQPIPESRAPTTQNWNSGGLVLPQGRVYYPQPANPSTNEPLPDNASTVVHTGATKKTQRSAKSATKSKTRVPTPVQARFASPPRRIHESPLERHNPRRHEAQSHNPLSFDRSPPNRYGQPAAQSQYESDPYQQNPSYGQNQGAYPQLQDPAPERIAYDPNTYRGNAPMAFDQQKPRGAAHASAPDGAWPTRGQDAAAADTLQRIHGYGGNNSHNNTMLSVHPPNQRPPAGGSRDRKQGGMDASGQHGTSQNQYTPQHAQQQVPAASKQPQAQQSWYGFNGLQGGSTSGSYSNYSWGGSGNTDWS